MIRIDTAAVRQSKWYEYAMRFLLGGLITAITGLAAVRFGAGVAGLFLAYPAIFPGAATLVAKHERERLEEHGIPGIERGKSAAALDACGAALGSLALLFFAAIVWLFLPHYPPSIVLPVATVVWFSAAVLMWWLHRRC